MIFEHFNIVLSNPSDHLIMYKKTNFFNDVHAIKLSDYYGRNSTHMIIDHENCDQWMDLNIMNGVTHLVILNAPKVKLNYLPSSLIYFEANVIVPERIVNYQRMKYLHVRELSIKGSGKKLFNLHQLSCKIRVPYISHGNPEIRVIKNYTTFVKMTFDQKRLISLNMKLKNRDFEEITGVLSEKYKLFNYENLQYAKVDYVCNLGQMNISKTCKVYVRDLSGYNDVWFLGNFEYVKILEVDRELNLSNSNMKTLKIKHLKSDKIIIPESLEKLSIQHYDGPSFDLMNVHILNMPNYSGFTDLCKCSQVTLSNYHGTLHSNSNLTHLTLMHFNGPISTLLNENINSLTLPNQTCALDCSLPCTLKYLEMPRYNHVLNVIPSYFEILKLGQA